MLLSLINNIKHAIEDFNSIKNSIIKKGVEVPEGTPTQKYGELILDIKSGGGEDENDDNWNLPSEWLEIPEPNENEIFLLVEVYDKDKNDYSATVQLQFRDPNDLNIKGVGDIIIDWGDGTSETYNGYTYDETSQTTTGESEWASGNLTHIYSENGQYLISITISEHNCLFYGYGENTAYPNLLAGKTGSNIVFNTYKNDITSSNLRFGRMLKYFKIFENNQHLIPFMFSSCYGLIKIDFESPITNVLNGMFQNCYSLKFIDTSQIKTIGAYGFMYCYSLKSLNAPLCTTVTQEAFRYCINLRSVSLPMCTSLNGTKIFEYCTSLTDCIVPKIPYITDETFSYCYSLKNIECSSCTVIYPYAFQYCYSLEEFNAPSCYGISNYAFRYCYLLHTANFSENGHGFSSGVFYECYSLHPRPDNSTY